MLLELTVRELGVIDELNVVLGSGLTAITGETGAGKTLVVEALALLLGARADATLVRAGAEEALVEGRFVTDGGEVILARAVAREGRSRGYLDGRMAPLSALEERGADLVELYAQHAQQALFQRAHQREALDRFAGIGLAEVRGLRAELARTEAELEELGGDERQRAREVDLLSFELAEITAAKITSTNEDELLEAEEELLANVVALRAAASEARERLESEHDGVLVQLAAALRALENQEALEAVRSRLRGLLADANDLASELRSEVEGFEEDPGRLAFVRERRQLLRGLMRKYGESLVAVLETAAELEQKLAARRASEDRRAELEVRIGTLSGALEAASARVGAARRAAAPALAAAVESRLHGLGLVRARIEVRVGDSTIGDVVELLLAANAGEPALALARVASGGELARAMLALRLVLTSAPPTLVFDEVDAGIGGEAALAVGRALAELATEHQVIVVTHLAQVAAFAQHQLVVDKAESAGRTIARCREVDGEARVVELSRMLSGHPDSKSARVHAAELLVQGASRGR